MPTNQVQNNFPFVAWLRDVAPYIHSFRGKTFVIGFAGELVQKGGLEALIQDVAMLHAMGMRIVLVHGSRPQVQEQLDLRKVTSRYGTGAMSGYRITDPAALECAKEASGELRLDIEAAFSQGLPNTPMAGSRISVISGNFIIARPVGIVDGVDFMHTGLVRKVDSESIQHSLANNKIVLMSPLGFSPTGQAFNIAYEDVATAAAMAVKADKLIFLTEYNGITDLEGELIKEFSLRQLEEHITGLTLSEADLKVLLQNAIRAIRSGVSRVHLLPHDRDGALLEELFTHDGISTMIAASDIEHLREANLDDVGGILQLIEPLEDEGILVARGRDVIERDITHFSVIEHDRVLFGCAALFPYSNGVGELSCLAVDPQAQESGDGERLLKRIEARAKAAGLKKIFVLTTRTEHWFLKRGFVRASVDDLPAERKELYNWERKSMVLIKNL
ncbi:amino-acid N-acetyltransferase [Polynucleobacter sp. 30F-ANTBAC]|jgi:amino-acid N-acetyltransferase|uniref:amino-acid N-acetyltransferase n=1 Tax=Polynucleobacter sp. 30F-ANTBAC TaxID=2689095 RepID=UPI001C0CF01A|nr:amino-acid N-acetyltransferase [Polynucleobacter sp. 30F-ANTBAC]MBU3599186.1 amino-acid N-acetyltransferase [Polynucleobacter sp. 30F-ANTBAC]